MSACSTNRSEKERYKIVELNYREDPETKRFINFWRDFSQKFNSLDTASVKKISLDTIWLWGEKISSEIFIKRYWVGYSSSGFSKFILDSNKTTYSSIGCHPSPPVKEAIKREYGDACNCQQVIINDTVGLEINALEFSFLNTTKGYLLFGIKNYSYNWSRVNSMVDTTEAEK